MNKASKEITPVEYSTAAVKILHFKIKPHTTCFQLHWHDRVEIIRVKKGQMVLQCYNNTVKLKEGEMILFTPKTAHGGYTDDEEVEYDVLMFDLKMFYNPIIYDYNYCIHYVNKNHFLHFYLTDM